jgi:long-chain acyl-CoA synthetase
MSGRPLRAVCYLPLCHFAERCYSMSMQLVLAGEISFAESIDTVAGNIREIAPTFFIGVPRIYEKLKQNFSFRLGETGRVRQGLVRRMMETGRALSDRRQAANGTMSLPDRILFRLLYWALFRNVQRYLGLDRSLHRLCAGASVSPETLRFFDIIGLPVSQGYGLTESGGSRLHSERCPPPSRRLRAALALRRVATGGGRRDPDQRTDGIRRLLPGRGRYRGDDDCGRLAQERRHCGCDG